MKLSDFGLSSGSNYHNQIPFCRVKRLRDKEMIERVFLQNQISYYVRWEEGSFLQRLVSRKPKDQTVYTIYIHEACMDKARGLVADMKNVKLVSGKK